MTKFISFFWIGGLIFWIGCTPTLQKKENPPSTPAPSSRTPLVQVPQLKENPEEQKQVNFPLPETTQVPENPATQTQSLQKPADEEMEAVSFVENQWKKIFKTPMSKQQREHLCQELFRIDIIQYPGTKLIEGRENFYHEQKLNTNQKKMSLFLCILVQQMKESSQKTEKLEARIATLEAKILGKTFGENLQKENPQNKKTMLKKKP